MMVVVSQLALWLAVIMFVVVVGMASSETEPAADQPPRPPSVAGLWLQAALHDIQQYILWIGGSVLLLLLITGLLIARRWTRPISSFMMVPSQREAYSVAVTGIGLSMMTLSLPFLVIGWSEIWRQVREAVPEFSAANFLCLVIVVLLLAYSGLGLWLIWQTIRTPSMLAYGSPEDYGESSLTIDVRRRRLALLRHILYFLGHWRIERF